MRKLSRTFLWTTAGVLLTAGPAPAFYFNGWPGSGEPIRRSLIPPGKETQPGNPPGTPPPGSPPEGHPPPILVTPTPPGNPPPPPEHVPEPATGLIGLLGLSAAAAARWLRKK